MRKGGVAIGLLLGLLLGSRDAGASGTKVGTLCRVKGQETQTLQAMGLVFGLNGTGDGGSFRPTQQALAMAMQVTGTPLGDIARELKDAKNVALVMVQVTVPRSGARHGELLDCKVSALAAKSLEGGRLFLTPLIGPVPEADPIVYAIAQGPITIDNPRIPTTGTIFRGAQLQEDFVNPFVEDGRITLVLEPHFAGIRMAQAVADSLNKSYLREMAGGLELAKAVDAVNIVVEIPEPYRRSPVDFAANLLDIAVIDQTTGPRVTINERAGTIVISGDVEIGPVVVTHKNVVVQAAPAAVGGFVAVDPEDPQNTKLQALVAALNAINVPTADVIDIIKEINRNGKLYASLDIQ